MELTNIIANWAKENLEDIEFNILSPTYLYLKSRARRPVYIDMIIIGQEIRFFSTPGPEGCISLLASDPQFFEKLEELISEAIGYVDTDIVDIYEQ